MRYTENNDAIKKYNCATTALLQRQRQMQRQWQKQRRRRRQEQQQLIRNNNISYKNHKRIRKKSKPATATTKTTTATIKTTALTAAEAKAKAAVFTKCNYNFCDNSKHNYNNNSKYNNRSRNSNKLLIALLSLMITMTVMTTTTTTICQTAALSMKSAVTAQMSAAAAAAAAAATTTTAGASTNTSALSLSAPSSSSPLASASATAAASFILSPTQQQQQQQQRQQEQHRQRQRQKKQQQQLFALLTKNRQTSGHYLQQQQQQHQQQLPTQRRRQYFDENIKRNVEKQLHDDGDGDNDDEDDAIDDNYSDDDATRAAANVDGYVNEHNEYINTSMETSGFIADDGQQYEKAEHISSIASDDAVAAGASIVAVGGGGTTSGGVAAVGAATNIVNCPKECKCLNDFFDCGKRHLDRVPEFPSYVQTIDLIGNRLNDTAVLQIKHLSELVKLSLKRNQLEIVPKFIGLLSLKQLNLANNRLQRISSEALAALPKLKALDLSRNILHTVESSYFPKSNRLAHLILSYNEIASVSENAYESLGDLIELDLSNNHLSTLPAGVFRSLGKLKKLSLNYNQLEINWSTFKGLTALQRLLLRSNNIRSLQDGVFHVMRAIESIELDHNSITSLSRQGLFNLTKLHHLSLSNNSISRIELDTWEFTQSLVTLDLSHNNISEFKPQHLECLQRLRHLNLGHNKINYLVESTFDCVKNLEDLNLRRNKLAWIIEDLGTAPPFKGLRKLKKLDLYGNNLKQINTKSLSGLSGLETLNLGGNSLASIQSGAFEHMPHLQKVNFKSLNFICDCELLWFRRWLQRTQTPQNSGNAVCGYPEHFLDREVVSLTPAELVCAETPKPVITQEPTNQLAVKGANITMECIAISPAAASLAAADELKIKWRHDNQQVRERVFLSNHHAPLLQAPTAATETQIHHNQETNQTTIIGYLRLYNVSYDSAGKYQCVVSNAFGTTYSQRFKMSIGIHPLFLQTPSNLTIDSGDTARLVCSATGDPMPEIALQKFGASDFPAATERRLKVVREENAFIITNAKPIDTGTYTCTAESAAGEIKINASLVVNDKPLPVIPMVRKEIVLTQPSVLECLTADNVAGDDAPPPPLNRRREWFKDNKPFHTSATSASERYYFTAAKELLIIVNTQDIDAGRYRCEINDDAKTYIIEMELLVRPEDDVSRHIVVMAVVCVTAACVLFGCCVIWLFMFVQKKKLRFGNISSQSGAAGGRHLASASATNTLSDSRSGTLERTQLTTLNRTYLQQQQQQQLQQHQLHLQHRYFPPPSMLQQRPRSAISAELEAEQRNSLIAAAATAACSPCAQRYPDDNGLGIGITLEYLTRGDMDGLLDHHHNQDHLSSKDSGTGSDAAAKRSIDDFTLSLLPADETSQMQQQQQQHHQGAIASTPAHKKCSNIDDETEFLELKALGGVSRDYVGGGNTDMISPPLSLMSNGVCKMMTTQDNGDDEGDNDGVDKRHLLRLNHKATPRDDAAGDSGDTESDSSSSSSSGTLDKEKNKRTEQKHREKKGKLRAAMLNKTNSSTNFYAVGNRQYAAVDI